MNIYVLFYLNTAHQNRQRVEISSFYKDLTSITDEILICNEGEDAESALKKSIQIQQNLYRINPIQELRILIYAAEIYPELTEFNSFYTIMKEYDCRILLNHLCFAQLFNPNTYFFRFIGSFPCYENQNTISLFDFLENPESDTAQQRIDSKAVFEDSIFNFYCNRISQSIAGFYNVLKLFPSDRASMKYIERGKEILSRRGDV